jgi:mannose-1-phosphate guanylyltransferase/mannose-6-phosphate isomerase
MSSEIIPVILCGGSGTRLWPLSRSAYPKQFHSFFSDKSLLQTTLARVNKLQREINEIDKKIIVTNQKHIFDIKSQLENFDINDFSILLEADSFNTAFSLTVAALQSLTSNEDPLLLILPCDQSINDEGIFIKAIAQAINITDESSILILGVNPTSPHTGFGYIEFDSHLKEDKFHSVINFIEKPSKENADKFFESKKYKWNSGIFILKAKLWIQLIKKFQLEIYEAANKAFSSRLSNENFIQLKAENLDKNFRLSIDYSVIEKCHNSDIEIKMVPLDCGWSDLGNWDSVWHASQHDQNKNATWGDVIIEGCDNSYIFSSKRLVVASGLSNLAIIETPDAILVAKKDDYSSIARSLRRLSDANRKELDLGRKVNRPWGWYNIIEVGENFKVKQIMINPGASLSLQSHSKRSEHWVVINGLASVICGESSYVIKQGESTFIPMGSRHRLSNKETSFLEIIEVQLGTYLEEDDILRFDDAYGRQD